MTNELLNLEAAGDWSVIRERREELLAAVAEADAETRARAHVTVSRGLYWTATTPADRKEALRHNRIALDLAPAGTFLQAWILQRMSSLLIDMGRPLQAKVYANTYLRLAHNFPEAQGRTPYVYRDLSLIAYIERRFMAAASLGRKAEYLFRAVGQDEEAARTRTYLVWYYLRAKRLDLACAVDLSEVPDHLSYLVKGAQTGILAAEGHWEAAYQTGREALAGSRQAHDFEDAAEVGLIVAQASHKLRKWSDAIAYISRATSFAARQGWKVIDLYALNSGQRGGDSLYVHAASSLGSGGLHLDACLTPGVG